MVTSNWILALLQTHHVELDLSCVSYIAHEVMSFKGDFAVTLRGRSMHWE